MKFDQMIELAPDHAQDVLPVKGHRSLAHVVQGFENTEGASGPTTLLIFPAMSGASSLASWASLTGSGENAHSISAPNRNACFSA